MKNQAIDRALSSTGRSYALYMVAFICACVILRLIFIGRLPLTAPEAYYWEWSKDLAWGYFDHPPMIAYVIRLFTSLGGDSAFFVRLGAVVLSLLTTVVLFLLVKDMFGKTAALTLCAVMQILPFFAAVGILSVPDAPLAFFWILTVYFVSRATILDHPRLWYAAGVSLGMALMSKYHAFLLIPCIFLYLLFSKDMRAWLRKKEPYLALMLGILVFLPNLLWNVEHRATTFSFLLVERHGALEFSFKGPLEFVAGFLAFMSPLFALLVLRWLPQIGRAAVKKYDNRYLLLLSTSIPPIVFFGLLSPFLHVGIHWVAVGYTTLCIAVIAVLMERRPPKRLYILHGFPLASLLVSLVLVLGAHLIPLIASSLPPTVDIAGRTYRIQITALQEELYGWKELRKHLVEAVKTMPGPDRTFFITHSYRVASHVRFLVGAEFLTRTTGYNEWQNQYLIWDDLTRLKGWDAIFVDKEVLPRHSELLLKIFEGVGPIEALEIKIDGVQVRTFCLIKCYGYKGRYIVR
jgi:hypothetical protein